MQTLRLWSPIVLLAVACSNSPSGIGLDGSVVVSDANPMSDGPARPDASAGCDEVDRPRCPDAAAWPDALSDAPVLPDSALPDAVVPDAVVPDAVVPDAVVPDAVVPDAVVIVDASLPDVLWPTPLPDAPTPLPDAAPWLPLPDAHVPLADAYWPPPPDVSVAEPDAVPPQPDAAIPVPDAAIPLPDAAVELVDAASPDAAPGECVILGRYDAHLLELLMGYFSDCPATTHACSPGASCSSNKSFAEYSTCTPTECAGSLHGSHIGMACHDNVTCWLTTSTASSVCVDCGANATCTFDDDSTGVQRFNCAEGSDCTINLSSLGQRVIDCSASSHCRVNGTVTGGLTHVDCGDDCVVDLSFFKGMEVCCVSGAPTVCDDGRVVCGSATCE